MLHYLQVCNKVISHVHVSVRTLSRTFCGCLTQRFCVQLISHNLITQSHLPVGVGRLRSASWLAMCTARNQDSVTESRTARRPLVLQGGRDCELPSEVARLLLLKTATFGCTVFCVSAEAPRSASPDPPEGACFLGESGGDGTGAVHAPTGV